MQWFKAHPVATLWVVWLGGGALLAGLIVGSVDLMTFEGSLMWSGQLMVAMLSIGYIATLARICYWVLEEKAQDRSIMWAFAILIVGGIFPIVVALFGKNNTKVDPSYVPGKSVEQASKFEIRELVDKAKAQPLDKDRTSAHALKKAQEHLHRAMEYENQGAHDKAIAEYTEAINAYSQNAMAYLNRATLLVKIGKKGVARTDFKRAIAFAGDTEIGSMAKRALEQLESESGS
jgi:tetratricopeptide (TPR) repeat protein